MRGELPAAREKEKERDKERQIGRGKRQIRLEENIKKTKRKGGTGTSADKKSTWRSEQSGMAGRAQRNVDKHDEKEKQRDP